MTATLDPMELEILRRQLEGIAEEMGRTLIRGAYSPNIKERRDASTAIFDREGHLVAQAEHIPVHLGAMPDAVTAVIDHQQSVGPTYLVNDPYHGGSHLPDVTIVGPMFIDGYHIGYAASRAHWADIGGPVPGGLAGDARTIFAEGLRIPPMPIAVDEDLNEELIEGLLANIRNPRHRRADLEAQLGAVAVARKRMETLEAEHGIDRLETAFDAVIAYARDRTEHAIKRLPDGTYQATDHLEGDGIEDGEINIEATVKIEDANLAVDFSGTHPQVPGNLNAPPAVAKSAVYFFVRCLTDPDIPSNYGCYDPIAISIPEGSLLDPSPPAAVGGGNVETSQRIVDVLLAAVREADPSLPAHGQGTMNNVVIGFEDGRTYYETIGGGAGGSANAHGSDGVHVGMTNTRNTPIEALERAYPIIVERYGLRPGSGGEGTHRGGCGIERSLTLEAPAIVTVLSERRERRSPGAAGGEAGAVGHNELDEEPLGAKATISVEAGARLRILTPGGGGYGEPTTRNYDTTDENAADGDRSEDR